jgi:hypothetical protein
MLIIEVNRAKSVTPKANGRSQDMTPEEEVGLPFVDIREGINIDTTIRIGTARNLAISLRRLSDLKSFLTMALSAGFKPNLPRKLGRGAYVAADSLTETGIGIQ